MQKAMGVCGRGGISEMKMKLSEEREGICLCTV